MTFDEVVRANKDVCISMTEKFLDTIYESTEEKVTTNTVTYEELRRSIIDEKPLTTRQQYLLVLLTSHTAAQFKNLAQSYGRASVEMNKILEQFTKILKIEE